MSNQTDAHIGHTDITDSSTDYAQIAAVTKQMQAQQAGSTIVKIVKVTPGPGGAYGKVDVIPQVHQIDGAGNTIPHATIYDVPYTRMQGGASAVIIDPAVGDLGICVFADRDISSVKKTAAAAPPGSRRINSMSDAMYVGGMLNGTPTEVVDFSGGQIKIVSTKKITLQAPEVDIVSPAIKLSGGTLTHNNVNIGATHVHGGVNPGGSKTRIPE